MATTSYHFSYEADAKLFILNNRQLFLSKHEDAVALFEKGISRDKTIADCLIFSRETGLVGIEIKTAHDTKKRLLHQLHDYTKVCDYVYVLLHDAVYAEAKPILDQYPQVGIYCYTEADGNLYAGKLREASYNKHDYRDTLDIMWWTELMNLAKLNAEINHQQVPFKRLHTKRSIENYLLNNYGSAPIKQFYDNVIRGRHDKDKVVKHYEI